MAAPEFDGKRALVPVGPKGLVKQWRRDCVAVRGSHYCPSDASRAFRCGLIRGTDITAAEGWVAVGSDFH